MDFGKATSQFIQMMRKGSDENQKTLISLGPNKEEFSYTDVNKPNFDVLKKYYKDFQVFTSLNVNAPSIMGQGFNVKGENEKAVKLCQEVVKMNSFFPSMIDLITGTLLFGTSALETVWSKDKKRIRRLKVIDVETIDLKWDKFGNITELTQKPIQGASGNTDPKHLKTDEFLLLRFFRLGDNIWGIGVVEIILDLLDTRRNMINNISEIIKFLSMPPIQVKKHGAKNLAELMKVEESLKDFFQKHYFCTSEKYDITPIEVKRAIPDLSKYLEKIDMYISIALRISMKVLSGDVNFTTKAASQALREYGSDEKAYYRGKIATEIEDQLFAPLCRENGISGDDVPTVEWKVDMAEDPKVRSEIMLNKVRALQMMEQTEEVKAKLREIIEKI